MFPVDIRPSKSFVYFDKFPDLNIQFNHCSWIIISTKTINLTKIFHTHIYDIWTEKKTFCLRIEFCIFWRDTCPNQCNNISYESIGRVIRWKNHSIIYSNKKKNCINLIIINQDYHTFSSRLNKYDLVRFVKICLYLLPSTTHFLKTYMYMK